jgi:hypothetical protein
LPIPGIPEEFDADLWSQHKTVLAVVKQIAIAPPNNYLHQKISVGRLFHLTLPADANIAALS